MIADLYERVGITAGHHIMMHSSFRKIRSAFPGITIDEVINSLQKIITERGSLIMPSFTYCFKRKEGNFQVYSKERSTSKTGAVTEYFRHQPGVIRTSSPTHSFALSGYITNFINEDNSPESPLGKGSVPDWLARRHNSYILMLGADFSSLSFGHYLETIAPVPWSDISPWDYLQVEKVGVSITGEQNLIEVPGCAKQFISFQEFLGVKGLLKEFNYYGLQVIFVPVSLLIDEGVPYFRNNFNTLLCADGICSACDSRRNLI